MAPALVALALAEKESLPKVIQAGADFLSEDMVGPCNWLDENNSQTLKIIETS